MFRYALQGSISKVSAGVDGVVEAEEVENEEASTENRLKKKAREMRTKRKQRTRDLMMKKKNPLQRK